MPGSTSPRRWFRIAYAANALRRMLHEQGVDVATMSASAGIRAMGDFMAQFRPQHGESDELWCSWGPRDEVFEFAVSRRMTRHGHPDSSVAIVFTYRLTVARAGLQGELQVATPRDATRTDGYRAIAAAAPVNRRID